MIAALCAHPCLDKSASLARFSPDAPNRIAVERLDVGGKGVNVARVAKALGENALLVSFDSAAHPVATAMGLEGVPCRLVERPGDLRVNLKIREEQTGRTIEINERGAAASPRALDELRSALLSSVQPGDWAVLSGSLPPSAPTDFYAALCRDLKRAGVRVAADCDGDALRAVVAAGPDLIKPNAQEFSVLTGHDPMAGLEPKHVLPLLDSVGAVCLSLGAEGAALVTREGAWRCAAPRVPVRGVTGAGDTLLSALLTALSRGDPPPEALRFASAAAGASIQRPGTLLCQREDVFALLRGLTVSSWQNA